MPTILAASSYPGLKREELGLRYAIEIYVINRDGAKDILHRTLVERINPAGARKEARRLFELFKRRNGVARLINSKGQTLYTVTE